MRGYEPSRSVGKVRTFGYESPWGVMSNMLHMASTFWMVTNPHEGLWELRTRLMCRNQRLRIPMRGYENSASSFWCSLKIALRIPMRGYEDSPMLLKIMPLWENNLLRIPMRGYECTSHFLDSPHNYRYESPWGVMRAWFQMLALTNRKVTNPHEGLWVSPSSCQVCGASQVTNPHEGLWGVKTRVTRRF